MNKNLTSKFDIKIINYFQKEELVAEIYYTNEQWAEISLLDKETRLKLYPSSKEEYWDFPCEEALKILEKAKTALLMTKNKGTFLQRSMPVDVEEVNRQAEESLEVIVNHPEKKIFQGKLERFGDVVDIYAPDKRGARFTSEGEFIGFLEF